ncbi:24632_t:CDS:2 [Dentiscutata erythropus]|uniref:24632_t:CDS:1 n=1 Tax=Dentiscutata erythropus TaxID=1348616 RepID=A0A9N9H2P3_9GLOM|nr:24632_t:CDS:2 [Dentiscutata erythropus]
MKYTYKDSSSKTPNVTKYSSDFKIIIPKPEVFTNGDTKMIKLQISTNDEITQAKTPTNNDSDNGSSNNDDSSSYKTEK